MVTTREGGLGLVLGISRRKDDVLRAGEYEVNKCTLVLSSEA